MARRKVRSRLSRYQEKKFKSRIFLATFGIIVILLFLYLFGVKAIISFSIFIDNIRGSTTGEIENTILVLPPAIDPLPSATNSAYLTISGIGTENQTAILYDNNQEIRRVTIDEDRTFSTILPVSEGEHVFSAKLIDGNGNLSELSNVVETFINRSNPILEIEAPEEEAEVHADDADWIEITGKTEPENTVTANGRFIMINQNGSFSYQYKLEEGLNVIEVIAQNDAGNVTKIERRVTFHL